MKRHLVIMSKMPRLGRVKTRLAADMGMPEATRIYRSMLGELLREVTADSRWQSHLALAPPAPALPSNNALCVPIWAKKPPGQLNVLMQKGEDLGARMANLQQRLPPGDLLFIGSDIPAIRRRHIARAFAALGNHDAVFGPSEDGGYWLLGLRRRTLALRPFANVRWSTSCALEDTLANLGGRRIAFLERLADIDDAADWRRHRKAPQAESAPARR